MKETKTEQYQTRTGSSRNTEKACHTQNETRRLSTLHDFIAAVKIHQVDGTLTMSGIQIVKTFEVKEIQCFQDL
jgi:hypothetical protein